MVTVIGAMIMPVIGLIIAMHMFVVISLIQASSCSDESDP
jgi:hypothetical protein